MNLYINTSSTYCEIALFKDEQILWHKVHDEEMSHSTILHEMIREALADCKITFEYALTAIAVLNGPGSYTGLRIGLAAAKGLCYALNIPLILFNKLNLLGDYYLSVNEDVTKIACIEPARANEYFFKLQSEEKIICEPNVQSLEFIQDQLNSDDEIILLSSSLIKSVLKQQISQISLPLEFIAQLTLNKLNNNELNDIFSSEPFYLKKVHVNVAKRRF